MSAVPQSTAAIQTSQGEDWKQAANLRDALHTQTGEASQLDWRQYGLPEWLADRVDRLGYRFPTEVQRQAAAAIWGGSDALIHAATGSGKTLAFLLPLLAQLSYPPDTYPEDLKGPQLVVIVPQRELGVQICLLIYKLFGGSLSSRLPGDQANMFTYKGPRGLKVKGVLDKEEVLFAKTQSYLYGAHVVVGTPDCLAELSQQPNAQPVMAHVRAVAVDEVDACFEDQSQAMQLLLTDACSQKRKPQIAMVGATVQAGLAATAADMGWMDNPLHIRVGAAGRIPAGLRHCFIAAEPHQKMAILCRQIRRDLEQQGEDAAPPRVMVFASSQEAAAAAAQPLRNVLWGQHNISVLLPEGEEPIKALQSFRDNNATLLLATPRAARGLDLPAISHIYNIDPPEDATEYLHRRSGRIGSPVSGTVTTLVSSEERPKLEAMASELGIELMEVEAPAIQPPAADPSADMDGAKKALEDVYNLY
eukprot:jgi/Astpho2/3480/Aster-08115